MFYKQFLKITNAFNPDFVDNFDYWLATLPKNNKKNITASVVSARLGVKYEMADAILNYAEKEEILEKYYMVKCPDCQDILAVITENEIADVLVNSMECDTCEADKRITPEDIYVAYKVVSQPEITDEELSKAIEKRLKRSEVVTENFTSADSLANNNKILYKAFYQPSESAYGEFEELREKLDLDYGSNTTAQGDILEKLVTKIFSQIRHVACSTKVKTKTNQFDCTVLCGINTEFPSVFRYLAPYFIIECKNEPKKKPNNSYGNKLLSIMGTNDAQVGIIFGRRDATNTCFTIAREHYLSHKNSEKHQILLTCCDKDLDYIIKERVNLLDYLSFKIAQVTIGDKNMTYDMFFDNGR